MYSLLLVKSLSINCSIQSSRDASQVPRRYVPHQRALSRFPAAVSMGSLADKGDVGIKSIRTSSALGAPLNYHTHKHSLRCQCHDIANALAWSYHILLTHLLRRVTPPTLGENEGEGERCEVQASLVYTQPSSSARSASTPVPSFSFSLSASVSARAGARAPRAHCASRSARQSSVVTNAQPGSSEKVRLLLCGCRVSVSAEHRQIT